MAKIVNLGSPGPQRESAMSGFASTYSAVAGVKEDRRRTNIMQQQADIQQGQVSNETQQLRAALAKAERVDEDKNRKLAIDTKKRISLRLMGKSESEQQIILDSDSIQALTKDLIKPYLPEAYDEKTKRLIPDRLEFFPKTEEEAREVKRKSIEGQNAIKARTLPTLSQVAAMEAQLASSAYSMGTENTPEVKEAMANIEKMKQAATKILQDANPNVFTGGLGENTQAQGDWWNQ